MSLSVLVRYWNTLRYLYPVQIYGRLWLRLYRPKPDLRPAPALRKQSGVWQQAACRASSLNRPDTFLFLNESGVLSQIGWNGSQRDKLWRYNQHYFDDLNAVDAPARSAWHQAMLEDWVRNNPPGTGTGWEPYPTSLRIVNWIKWVLAGNRLSLECMHNLAVQIRWLRRRLEIHLLGNHLFANAKALVFAGLFFDCQVAKEWLSKGLAVLKRELPEQILADGGHFELSPMYHQIVFEDMLDLINLYRAYERPYSDGWNESARCMLHWLKVMQHPDGGIAFFNDAAFGIAPTDAELEAYATRLGFSSDAAAIDGITDLAATGYFRLQQGAVVVFVDTAPVGPDYLPAHAHADTLSCELSLFGQRVFVNSGTSVYGLSEERQRQRSTAAHNTLLIDGRNSSEVWAGFRVGRRARVIERRSGIENGTLWVNATHDGYRSLAGAPIHCREWRLDTNRLEVVDQVKGRGLHELEVLWHLHPEVRLTKVSETEVTLSREGFKVSLACEGGVLTVEPTTWHPMFGVSQASQRLVLRVANELPRRLVTHLSWSLQ